ncbi:MAG: hypothetical protein R3336_03280, partial [Phycisphaeraceae bacterium]|nr:hypothetical protein [Phycisphaeraceae bacterium]
PESAMRAGAMNQVVRRGWDHLVVPMLRADDPRLRHAGLMAMTGMFKGSWLPGQRLTDAMFDEVGRIIENPDESWWVTLHAVKALRRSDGARIARHRDRLLELLEYDSEWLQSETIVTLSKIAAGRDHYRTVLPVLIDKSAALRTSSPSWNAIQAVKGAMQHAGPEVKTFAGQFVKEAYGEIPAELADPYTGAVMKDGSKTLRRRLGSIIEQLPEGDEFLRRTPKMTLKAYKSGQPSDMFVYKGRVEPNPKVVGTWHWAIYPPPKNPGEIDWKIKDWIKKQKSRGPIKLKNPKDTLVLKEGGEVAKSHYFRGYFWSGNMLVSNQAGLARRMEIRTYDGQDYLIIEKDKFHGGEKGDGSGEVAEDFHPGFNVYIRASR